MVTRFIKTNAEVWDVILDHMKRTRDRRAAAIAYCYELDLLPLRKGDVLVCDASEHAIATGQTNAETLKELIVRRKVKVFSVEGLHAKVVLAGDYAIVGSMNASARSRDRLLEAAVVSDDVAIVRAAEDWIEELCEKADERIGIRRANQLCKIEVKRRGGYAPPKRKMKKTPAQFLARSDDWYYIYCREVGWSAVFERQAKPVLRRLRRESEDSTYAFDAIEYRGNLPLDMAIGSRFFLGSFGHYRREPVVYRECLVVNVLPGGGLFYKYPKHYDIALWEPFRAKLAKHGYRLRKGRTDRRFTVGIANEILRDWGDLVAQKS